jgi:hypothetical protein
MKATTPSLVVGTLSVERGFIWQRSALNYTFCNPKESQLLTLSTLTMITAIFSAPYSLAIFLV